MMWFAIATRSRRELSVAADTRRDGVEVFVPVVRVCTLLERRRGGTPRRREHIRPLTPGYIFSRDPYIDHDHILGVLSIDGSPVPITEDAMQPLFLQSGQIVSEPALPKPIEVGELVRMSAGPYQGQPATVERIRKGRIEVHMRLFGRASLVHVPSHMVERVA